MNWAILNAPVKRRTRFSVNFTTPSATAKSESSEPMLTFKPGRNPEPRWRTKILPALAISPAYNLTPKRWPWESRPFEVDPPAFLCAIDMY